MIVNKSMFPLQTGFGVISKMQDRFATLQMQLGTGEKASKLSEMGRDLPMSLSVRARLSKMQFVSGGNPAANADRFQLSGNLSEMISQVVGFQGSTINAAISKNDDRQMTLGTIVDQMESDYGVNVDEEMARLMELQNAYSANARVVSVVKELLDALLAAT